MDALVELRVEHPEWKQPIVKVVEMARAAGRTFDDLCESLVTSKSKLGEGTIHRWEHSHQKKLGEAISGERQNQTEEDEIVF
ncbi:MAG: hypothetical protein CL912_12855 [Deltaproteobacteria bacterium]|nr:hypothetical protein [Deltaproteobacteria bacterium]|tara:strand:+ start:634 stop:879 length:246 start_codon:yes stop_codon:yes gene_type:complete